MTKKRVKTESNQQTYVGWNGHRIRINAFFFDYKQGCGYKYMLAANVNDMSKADLFNLFYDWVSGKTEKLPWFVKSRIAETDEKRFKISLSM